MSVWLGAGHLPSGLQLFTFKMRVGHERQQGGVLTSVGGDGRKQKKVEAGPVGESSAWAFGGVDLGVPPGPLPVRVLNPLADASSRGKGLAR